MDDELSRAVQAWAPISVETGYGLRRTERLRAVMGAEAAERLLPRIEALVKELHRFEPRWDEGDLGEMADRAVAALRLRHPELAEEALGELRNYWSYCYR